MNGVQGIDSDGADIDPGIGDDMKRLIRKGAMESKDVFIPPPPELRLGTGVHPDGQVAARGRVAAKRLFGKILRKQALSTHSPKAGW